MGEGKQFFNFEYLRDGERRGGYFRRGESWGLLTEEELNLDFDSMVIILAGNPIPQDDGPLNTPESLEVSPENNSQRTRVFYNSSFQPPRRRQEYLSSTKENLLSIDGYLDEEYEDQQNMTITTDDEEVFSSNCPGLQRPSTFYDVPLNQVLDLANILVPTNQVVRDFPIIDDAKENSKPDEGNERK